MLQAESVENVGLGVVAEALARDAFEYILKGDEVGAAVDKLRSGLGATFVFLYYIRAELFRAVVGMAAAKLEDTGYRGEAGGMGHQLAHGNPLDPGTVLPRREAGKVLVYIVVEPDAALLDQLHQRDLGPDALAQRGKVKDGSDGHGLGFRVDAFVAVGLLIDDGIALDYAEHGPRRVPLRDGGQNNGITLFESGQSGRDQ